MRITYWVSLTIVLFLFLGFWILLISETSAGPNNMTIKESKKSGVFIKEVHPIPKEVYYNDKFNIVLNKAWLEHRTQGKSYILWKSYEVKHDWDILKVNFSFKNRLSGEVKDYIGPGVKEDRVSWGEFSFTDPLSNSGGTGHLQNIATYYFDSNINNEFKLILYTNDNHEKKNIVLFK